MPPKAAGKKEVFYSPRRLRPNLTTPAYPRSTLSSSSYSLSRATVPKPLLTGWCSSGSAACRTNWSEWRQDWWRGGRKTKVRLSQCRQLYFRERMRPHPHRWCTQSAIQDFCKNISSKQFYLYFVNSEDNKVEHSLLLDYSCLLTPTHPPSFSFESNTIRAMGVDSFSLKLTADKPLLLDLYRQYLNPLEVEIVGAKDLPVEKSSRY